MRMRLIVVAFAVTLPLASASASASTIAPPADLGALARMSTAVVQARAGNCAAP